MLIHKSEFSLTNYVVKLDIKLCACTELPLVRMLWSCVDIVFILVQVILCPHSDCSHHVMVI